MVDMHSPEVEYLIDSTDRILQVNDAWRQWAQLCQTPELQPETLIGQSLWRYIADAETREIYDHLLAKVRTASVPVRVSLRCDSPVERRFLQLSMTPASRGAVRFSSTIERTEPRAPVRLLDPAESRDAATLAICGWCKRVRVSSTTWREAEQAIQELQIFASYPLPRLTHRICSSCLQAAVDLLRDPGVQPGLAG